MFVYYQQLHLKNFRGASKSAEVLLSVFVSLGMLTGLIFLVYYGIQTIWWAPFLMLVAGILFTFIGVFIEKLIGIVTLSYLGFLALPVLAYLMFMTIP
jgi:hypothetical protein